MLAFFTKNGKTQQILRMTARQTISLSSREPFGFEAISYGPAVPAQFSRINRWNGGIGKQESAAIDNPGHVR
jgi:hypothetical protein